MNLEIRAATAADSKTWAALRAELWPDCPEPRHRLEIEQLLRSSGLVALALVGGEIAGFAEVSLRSDHVEGTTESPVPYLEGWYVRPGGRGRGVGRALIRFVEVWATGQGFGELASDAELPNEASIVAHRALGFVEVGRSVHFVRRLSDMAENSDK